MPRKFPVPWQAVEIPGGWRVVDGGGAEILNIYAREDLSALTQGHGYMNRDEAERLARAIAKLPDMRRVLEQRKASIAGCLEDTEEAAELASIAAALGEE